MQLLSKIFNLCGPGPPTPQTDRRTDGQMTCDLKTALCSCTIVHSAVKRLTYAQISNWVSRFIFGGSFGFVSGCVIVCLLLFFVIKMDSARPLLTEEPAYKALLQYFNGDGRKLSMAQMFQQDQGRFSKFRCSSYRWPSRFRKVILYFFSYLCQHNVQISV